MIAGLAELPEVGPGHFRGEFDASWNQGPGTFGGLLSATLGRCLERVAGEGGRRTVRALSVHLCAPAEPGPLDVRVVVERKGAAVTYASARIERDGLPLVLATATLASGRTEDADFDRATPPDLHPVERLPDLGTAPGVPVFTQHFAFRFSEGVPFTGGANARSAGWLRPRVDEPLTTPLALALLDAWPLAVLPMLPRPRPAASVAIHFQLFAPLATQSDGWYRTLVTSDLNRQGYSDQVNAVWDASGRLIGRSHQLVAIVR
ncbi:MAG: thioesterase family protein [Myxococcota bacterium]